MGSAAGGQEEESQGEESQEETTWGYRFIRAFELPRGD